MRRKTLLLYVCFLAASFAPVASGEEAFDPVKVIYMRNGEAIYCQMASLEGIHMVCRKANGSVSVPLRSVDLEKTFPKYQNQPGEAVLLVHAGQLYRDEKTIVSNLRMVREHEDGLNGSGQIVILCDVINRSDPCDIRITIIARDNKGGSRFALDLDSDTRVDKDERAVLKKLLDSPEDHLENHIVTLRIGDVERRNILKKGGMEDDQSGTSSPERIREQKMRTLKESFLK
ncbi:MAG: hypothetical protein R6X07_05335 [Desulfatiglandales bacterium]